MRRSGIDGFEAFPIEFHGVLSRIPAHSITQLTELLPHNRQTATSVAEA
jgi:hypothetical protein